MPGRKHKKAFRRLFDKRKRVKSRQDANKENIEVDEEAGQLCSEVILPEKWQRVKDDQFCKIVECSSGGGLKVTVSLTFASKWVVHVGEKAVPACDVFTSLDPMDKQKAADFMNAIDRSYVCVGNPEETFVNAWQKKEGKTNCGDVNGEFDRASVVDPKGIVYNGTEDSDQMTTPYIKYYNLSFLLCHCKQSLLDLLPKLYRIHH